MILSETYKIRLKCLAGILEEENSKTQYEYQIRYIDGDIFYKRDKGEELWSFTSDVDYYKNSNSKNIIKWEELK